MDSGRNVLGVCCVELTTVLAGEGRPVRQDDVFTVRIGVVDPMQWLTSLSLCQVEAAMDLETMDQAADTGGPFVIINIAADSAEVGSQVRILSRYLHRNHW